MAETTKVKFCSCEHKWQDERYGQHNRLHNLAKSKSATGKAWTCTVCGKKSEE